MTSPVRDGLVYCILESHGRFSDAGAVFDSHESEADARQVHVLEKIGRMVMRADLGHNEVSGQVPASADSCHTGTRLRIFQTV